MHTACDVKLCALVAKLIIFHRLWKMFITNRGRNSNCLRLEIARDHHDDHHYYDQRATPRLPAVPADWPQPNYNNNSKCIEDAKLNVSPRSFAKNNTQSRAAERRAEESRIEKCVSLNFIYSRQFYAFKARLSTATSASGWGSTAAAAASPCGNGADAILKLTVARRVRKRDSCTCTAPLRPQ